MSDGRARVRARRTKGNDGKKTARGLLHRGLLGGLGGGFLCSSLLGRLGLLLGHSLLGRLGLLLGGRLGGRLRRRLGGGRRGHCRNGRQERCSDERCEHLDHVDTSSLAQDATGVTIPERNATGESSPAARSSLPARKNPLSGNRLCRPMLARSPAAGSAGCLRRSG